MSNEWKIYWLADADWIYEIIECDQATIGILIV